MPLRRAAFIAVVAVVLAGLGPISVVAQEKGPDRILLSAPIGAPPGADQTTTVEEALLDAKGAYSLLTTIAQAQPGSEQSKPAPAEPETPWRLLVTPQIWFSQIPSAPFARACNGQRCLNDEIRPQRNLTPQYGGNFALNHDRWTFAVGLLHADYFMIETFNFPGTGTAGEIRQEVNRLDFDTAVTYTFLDVIPNLLDVSLGLGIKYIHTEYTMQIVRPVGATFTLNNGTRIERNEDIVGGTLPISLSFSLIRDKLLLPVSATPIVGIDTNQFGRSQVAYGGTLDVGLRWLFDNGVSVTGGFRGQALQGGPTGLFGAYGPFFAMTVPFNF